MKNLYDHAIKLPGVSDYLPTPQGSEDNLRFPERDFFWKILSALHAEQVEDWVKQAKEMRKPKTTNLQEQKWAMGITEEWMDQLLLHDYESCKSRFGLDNADHFFI